MVKKTGLVFITLKKPINFLGNSIRVVVSFVGINKEEYAEVVNVISKVLSLKDFDVKIKKQKNYESLISYFKSNL